MTAFAGLVSAVKVSCPHLEAAVKACLSSAAAMGVVRYWLATPTKPKRGPFGLRHTLTRPTVFAVAVVDCHEVCGGIERGSLRDFIVKPLPVTAPSVGAKRVLPKRVVESEQPVLVDSSG